MFMICLSVFLTASVLLFLFEKNIVVSDVAAYDVREEKCFN